MRPAYDRSSRMILRPCERRQSGYARVRRAIRGSGAGRLPKPGLTFLPPSPAPDDWPSHGGGASTPMAQAPDEPTFRRAPPDSRRRARRVGRGFRAESPGCLSCPFWAIRGAGIVVASSSACDQGSETVRGALRVPVSFRLDHHMLEQSMVNPAVVVVEVGIQDLGIVFDEVGHFQRAYVGVG